MDGKVQTETDKIGYWSLELTLSAYVQCQGKLPLIQFFFANVEEGAAKSQQNRSRKICRSSDEPAHYYKNFLG